MKNVVKTVAASVLATVAVAASPLALKAQDRVPSIQVDYYRKTAFQELYGGSYVGPREYVTTAPTGKVLPLRFSLPIETAIFQDTSIRSNTPITDAFGVTRDTNELIRWAETIGECLQEKPRLVRVLTGNTIYINDVEGSIVENANGVLVCPR